MFKNPTELGYQDCYNFCSSKFSSFSVTQNSYFVKIFFDVFQLQIEKSHF